MTVLFSLVVALVLAEFVVRVLGYTPWEFHKIDAEANEPVMHVADPLLGWRNKAGTYQFPRYGSEDKHVTVSFLPSGERKTVADGNRDIKDEVFLIGGSYTMGWGLGDEQTFAWKIQHQSSSYTLRNYAVAGYGTYQSLLALKRQLDRGVVPKYVVYGFIDHHEIRNVADAKWLRTLSRYSRRNHVQLPYVTHDEQYRLIHHPPDRYPRLPLSDVSALVALSEWAYASYQAKERSSQDRVVTSLLIRELDRLAESHGAVFIVALLRVEDGLKQAYIEFLQKTSIPYVDCTFQHTAETVLPIDNHPNELMNEKYADCISKKLENETLAGNSAR